MGVAYDPAQDRIYVSFCKVGCSTFGGAVGAFDPGTGTYIGDLFPVPNYLLGGLAFDPATGHLWVAEWDGVQPVIASMSLDGAATFSSFVRPGARFVDGLEFIGACSIR
jgi:DNA-binding beta-propeller fold protein YncE